MGPILAVLGVASRGNRSQVTVIEVTILSRYRKSVPIREPLSVFVRLKVLTILMLWPFSIRWLDFRFL